MRVERRVLVEGALHAEAARGAQVRARLQEQELPGDHRGDLLLAVLRPSPATLEGRKIEAKSVLHFCTLCFTPSSSEMVPWDLGARMRLAS